MHCRRIEQNWLFRGMVAGKGVDTGLGRLSYALGEHSANARGGNMEALLTILDEWTKLTPDQKTKGLAIAEGLLELQKQQSELASRHHPTELQPQADADQHP